MLRSNMMWLACALVSSGLACAADPGADVQGRDTELSSGVEAPAREAAPANEAASAHDATNVEPKAYNAPAQNNASPAVTASSGLWGAVVGSGKRTEEERQVSGFARVEASTGVTVDVSIGPEHVVVSADDNVLPYIRTIVNKDVLIIDVDTSVSVSSALPLAVHVALPELKSASASVGSVLTVKDITAKELTLEADSGSTVRATGAVDHLAATATIGGVLNAQDLKAKQVVLSANIGGSLTVTATEDVSGALDFGSVAHVSGHPAHRSVNVALGSSLTLD